MTIASSRPLGAEARTHLSTTALGGALTLTGALSVALALATGCAAVAGVSIAPALVALQLAVVSALALTLVAASVASLQGERASDVRSKSFFLLITGPLTLTATAAASVLGSYGFLERPDAPLIDAAMTLGRASWFTVAAVSTYMTTRSWRVTFHDRMD